MRLVVALSFLLVSTAHAITLGHVDKAAAHADRGLRQVVKKLAGKKLAGRDNQTQGSTDAQAFLVKQLKSVGAEGLDSGASGDAAYLQPFTHLGETGTNVVGVMRGGDLAHEYVMIGAHYDHLDSRSDGSGYCVADGEPGGEICNGAADNASGVAATLAIARAIQKIAKKIKLQRRSVILAFWDAEEDFLNGSAYYSTNPLVPNDAVKGYINFDIQGANLLPSLTEVSFAVGAETGGSPFQAFVADAVAAEGLDTLLLSYIFGQLRSDYVNLVQAGIPTVFFTDANNGCYHTVQDDPKFLDWKKLKKQTHIAFRVAMMLTETDTPPPFRGPADPAATFADLQGVSRIVNLGQADLSLMTPDDQAMFSALDADLQARVAEGPASFDSDDVSAVLLGAANSVNAFRRVPCQKF
jgi:hypothetical protein